MAHRVLEDGSYCDDELMADYLGGVLAAGRSPGGRDDRGVVWSSLIARMSSLQIRTHFLLYREWAARLPQAGRPDLNLGLDRHREASKMCIDLGEFFEVLLTGHDVSPSDAIGHVVYGLIREGLLGENYAFGSAESLEPHMGPVPYDPALVVIPSGAGIELYGWAQGEPGITPHAFLEKARVFGEDEISRLGSVVLLDLQGEQDGEIQ